MMILTDTPEDEAAVIDWIVDYAPRDRLGALKAAKTAPCHHPETTRRLIGLAKSHTAFLRVVYRHHPEAHTPQLRQLLSEQWDVDDIDRAIGRLEQMLPDTAAADDTVRLLIRVIERTSSAVDTLRPYASAPSCAVHRFYQAALAARFVAVEFI